jgi:uncharacterized protein YqgV (UPF0045/DUF77 family)
MEKAKMSLKPSDIDYIIKLIQKITEAATKDDFLSVKEQMRLDAYRDYEWCTSQIAQIKQPEEQNDKEGKLLKLTQKKLKSIQIQYDADDAKQLKRKLSYVKLQHRKSTIEPLQEKLDLYLARFWSDLKKLSFQYENLQKWIWGTWLSSNIMSLENNIVYDNKSAMVVEFAKIHGDERQTIRELKRIRERVRYQDKKPEEAVPASGSKAGGTKGIIRKLIKIIVGIIGTIIIGIIGAVVTDILGDFGWLEKIRTTIHNILTPK